MDLILLNDGVYSLVPITKQMIKGIELFAEVDCFDLCDILRLHLTTYYASDIYKAAVDELFEAEVKSNTLDNKRDKEALIIDLFRTLEASRRKNNI